MKYIAPSVAALGLWAVAAQAGGIERLSSDYGLLFQNGNQLQLSFSTVTPNVSGDYTAALTAAGGGEDSTGNMANSYQTYGFGYKHDVNDKLAFGLYVNTPYGASSEYTQGVYSGLTADWNSNQVAALARYRLSDRVSVYGGARYVESTAEIEIPDLLVRSATGTHAQNLGAEAAALGAQAQAAGLAGDLAAAQALGAEAAALGAQAQTLGAAAQNFGTSMAFSADGARVGDWGAVLGAAYEIPDIALRIALTWESEITHSFRSTETIAGLGINNSVGTTKVTMPQSLALDVQSGVAPGTLVFGQVKWVEWSKWEVRTPEYEGVTGREITGFESDRITWKLGIGRQFTDEFSGFAQIKYEAQNDDPASRLSPTDGIFSVGLGGQYTHNNMKLRGGIEYARLGDATDRSGVEFTGNDALGVGVSLTFEF